MPETLRNYQAILDMGEEQVSWKTFYVLEAGKTNGAHIPIVQKLKGIGQTEVTSDSEEHDYLLVFCPVVSRVGVDIGEALGNIPPGKPVILVVMHHTFDPRYAVAGSQRQVKNPNVRLTVDCLFYEGNLLDCRLNDIMWGDTLKLFGAPRSQVCLCRNCRNWGKKNPVVAAVLGSFVIIIVIIFIFVIVRKHSEEP